MTSGKSWPRPPLDRFIFSTFDRARRREIYRQLGRIVRRSGPRELLELDEVRRRLRLFDQTYVGIIPIPVNNIIGSTERNTAFDRDFLPLRADVRERWREIELAFPDGEFPPIAAYKVGDSYFIEDGHHRVAIAKQMGIEYIDAEVTELRARYEIPEGLDIGEIIHAEQRRLFLEESGLDRACPEARIELTRPDGYVELLDTVKVHGYHMMFKRGEVVSTEEIARNWYEHEYVPAVDAIRSEALHEAFPHCTDGDLFLWAYERRRRLFPELGSLSLEDVARREGRERSRPSGRKGRRNPRRTGEGDS
jgi:hypothetical protein